MPVYSDYSNIASTLALFVGRVLTPRLYLMQPQVVFAGQVHQPSAPTYPISFFAYNNVTVGDFTDVKPGMTVIMGTTPGSDNLGRQRIRSDATSVSIFVGQSSRGLSDGELTIVNDAYFEVWLDYRVWAKIPRITPSGVIYKDYDLEVGTNTTTPPPVANTGPPQAGTIDSSTEVITSIFDGQESFAVADGATIASYLWDIDDGTLVGMSALTDESITVTFPAGFRYVSLTVTDSNGKTHTAYCAVYARDPDNDTSFSAFQIENRRATEGGVSMTIRILEDMPQATYPDGTLAMMWDEEGAGRPLLMFGWLDTENATINAGRNGLLRDTTLTILDVAHKLDSLPGLPQSIADDTTRDTDLLPSITWNYMTTPNLDKYLHYLLHWHSTALEVADFVWSGTGSAYEFVLLSSDGDSLWNQVDRRARAFVPDRVLTCSTSGEIRVVPDPQLQDEGDRTATVQANILESAWSDLRFEYRRAPRVHWLRASAILAGDSEPIGTVFSIAPGDTPGQGVGEVVQGEQLAISQDALNAATGHRYARVNSRYGLLTLTLVQDDDTNLSTIPWRNIDPSAKEWVTLTVSAETAAQRGLTFTTARCLPKEVSERYNHDRTGLTRTVTLVLEVETVGEPGNTVVKPDVPAVGDDPPWTPPQIPVPDFGLVDGQELVAGIGLTELYRTADFQTVSGSGGPTWTAHTLTTEDILSWVVDPFSPGYLTGTGTINGWVVTGTDIYRVTDIFGTVGCTSIHTFAQALGASDVPAQEWRTIQASFGTYFVEGLNPWLMVVSHYRDTTGLEGTWALYSKDGGATWETEVQISEFYDSGTSTDTRPIAVYLSPKTPGLAYAAAYYETGDPPQASGFVSTDWGETWTQMVGDFVDDPDAPLPRWGHWDEDDNLTLTGLTGSASATIGASHSGSGGTEATTWLSLAPPANAVRVTTAGLWATNRTRTGSVGGAASSVESFHPGAVAQTGDVDFENGPTLNSGAFGAFSIEYTFGGVGDWPQNRDEIVSSPPADPTGTIYLQLHASATGGVTSSSSTKTVLTWWISEIELDTGEIYQPPFAVGTVDPNHRLGGAAHVPWILNDGENLIFHGYADATLFRQFRLMRVNPDSTIDDISPIDDGITYGVAHHDFAVRAYDSDRDYVLVGARGNDSSASEGDDQVGVWRSIDGGDTWTNILAPVAASTVGYGLSAAFSGSDPDILFVWGGLSSSDNPILYSEDGGSTLDSRKGNLASLSAEPFCGICGGPI